MSSAEKPAKVRKNVRIQEMRVPAHGKGMIRVGSLPGNTPGTGRPPSMIRAAMRETLDQSLLEDLLKKYKAGEVDALGFANFLAKYGLGEKNEMTLVSPDVQTRLQATVNLVSKTNPEILDALEQIWK